MSNILKAKTFINPVYNRSFPDPFVLKFQGKYFAFCTGLGAEGRCFGRLRSDDLITWEELPGAMPPLGSAEPLYWAPEVTYTNGKFYLYYSAGNETFMTIRVAISDTPDGDFTDSGTALTEQDFAIDPHVFRDTDGRTFMFYATDFLDYSHIGTGVVVDEMTDPFTLRGSPRPVTRAQFDWQVYDPVRKEKGGVRWHTVEGPFVLKRKDHYYEMFSGGNWKNTTYGVSFAVTDDIQSDKEWSQYCDGVKTPPILQTVPERVIGPGHNSAVRGPNNRELYCVYHRWDLNERVMAVDRMDFPGGGRMFVIGPTFERQPVPYQPSIKDNFHDLKPERWTVADGKWQARAGQLYSRGQNAEIKCDIHQDTFLCDVSFRIVDIADYCSAGITLNAAGQREVFAFESRDGEQTVSWRDNKSSKDLQPSPRFDLATIHEVTIEVDHATVKITLDHIQLCARTRFASKMLTIGLFSENCVAAFSDFSITDGFEELFENGDLSSRGWRFNYPERFRFESKTLFAKGDEACRAQLSKRVTAGNHDLAVNLRFEHQTAASAVHIHSSSIFTIKPFDRVVTAGNAIFQLPEKYRATEHHQFRSVFLNGQTTCHMDEFLLGTVDGVPADHLSIHVERAEADFDMVRYTVI